MISSRSEALHADLVTSADEEAPDEPEWNDKLQNLCCASLFCHL